MKPTELRDEIAYLEKSLESKKRQLAEMYTKCTHAWGEVKYNPILIQGFTVPGDPVGTMGVDWRGPCHVESRTERLWERVCKKCELKQTTSRTEKKSCSGTIAGTSGEMEVPVFSSNCNY